MKIPSAKGTSQSSPSNQSKRRIYYIVETFSFMVTREVRIDYIYFKIGNKLKFSFVIFIGQYNFRTRVFASDEIRLIKKY